MQVFRINTTAFDEEDFFLLTDLDTDSIESVLQPIIDEYRNEDDEDYTNEDLVAQLKAKYPHNAITMYQSFETLTF